MSDGRPPVRVCHRYLRGRANQLDYREAIAKGLLISSGSNESTPGYVAQQRLKLPDA